MARCTAMRPVVQRMAEGDVSPADSLRLARHLSCCTACRIVLARDRRLARVLEAIDDPLPVDADFAKRVMAALPSETRARSPARTRRRGLAIAGLGALVALGSGALLGLAGPLPAGGALPGFPRLTLEGFEPLDELVGGIVRFVVLILDRAGSGSGAALPGWHAGEVAVPSVVLPAAVALAAIVTLAVLAAGGTRAFRRSRGPSCGS